MSGTVFLFKMECILHPVSYSSHNHIRNLSDHSFADSFYFALSGAMLSSPFTSMVESKAITSNCLIKVTDYTLSTPSNSKKVLCITQLTVVKTGEEVGQKLGDPVPLKYGEQGGDAPAKDGEDSICSSTYWTSSPTTSCRY